MKKKSIREAIEKYELNDDPVMIYDLSQLKSNINKVLYLRSKYNMEFVFPVKSFPSNRVLKLFSDFNFGYDVANLNEFSLIKEFLKKDSLVSFNGISFSSIRNDSGNILYNLNSLEELKYNNFYNGLRINTYIKNKTEFSRFGIDIKKIHHIKKDKIRAISFHFYDKNKSNKIKYFMNYTKICMGTFKNLDYVNFGGSWDILNVDLFEKEIQKIRKVLPQKIKLIFEIGENWFNNCGYLITRVIGKNEIQDKRIIYINAVKDSVSKWAVLNPINLNYGNQSKYTYIISGSSCYEKDVFYLSSKEINISMKDKIIFIGLNGYSYAWCKEFNGSNQPKVIFYE